MVIKALSELSGSIASGTSTYPITKNGIYPRYGSTGIIGFSDKFEYEGTKILVARVGANAGRLNFVTGQYGVSDNALIIDVLEENDAKYIFYQLDAMNLNKLVFGSGQPLITGNQLKELRIIYFSSHEQTAIAAALSDTDALIDSLEKLIAKKQAIKQGVMQELLTGKRRLKGFSGEWKISSVGDFAEIYAGGTPNTNNASYWNGTIPWMNSGELNDKIVYSVEGRITQKGLENSSTRIIPKNCVLIGLAGQGKTRGTAAYNLISLCTNQSIAAIFPNERYNSKYLYYFMDTQYEKLRELSSGGGGRGGLNKAMLLEYKILMPVDIYEQKAIAQILTDMDNEISALQKKLDKVRRIKQGMMAELLTGRIRLI